MQSLVMSLRGFDMHTGAGAAFFSPEFSVWRAHPTLQDDCSRRTLSAAVPGRSDHP
jgi:hypothetical protein